MQHYASSSILLLLIHLLTVKAFEPAPISRRQAFFLATGGAVAVSVGANGILPAEAVLRSKGCYQGEGEGCSDLAGDNELIRSLQAKSLENKDRNEQEARDAYYNKNYPEFFATVGKVMIKKQDGSYMLVSTAEAAEMQQAGKLTLVSPMTKGGNSKDYTQKPILTLKE